MSGAELLTSVEQEFGISVADEDLNLESLYSLETLCHFIGEELKKARP
jgi:acyl carrier protein